MLAANLSYFVSVFSVFLSPPRIVTSRGESSVGSKLRPPPDNDESALANGISLV